MTSNSSEQSYREHTAFLPCAPCYLASVDVNHNPLRTYMFKVVSIRSSVNSSIVIGCTETSLSNVKAVANISCKGNAS